MEQTLVKIQINDPSPKSKYRRVSCPICEKGISRTNLAKHLIICKKRTSKGESDTLRVMKKKVIDLERKVADFENCIKDKKLIFKSLMNEISEDKNNDQKKKTSKK